MLGIINDCAEQLVVSKFGLDAWHAIKKKAGCEVKDYEFVLHDYYPDSATVDIVVAAAETLGVGVDVVLELFGQFFLEYSRKAGYASLLNCQGSTLRTWLSNLNALHDHLSSSLPTGCFPSFWCEDDEDVKGTILLHYWSHRGSLLAPLVVGIVKEVAVYYFDVEIAMERIASQDEDGSEFTSWRISTCDPQNTWKLSDKNVRESVVQQHEMERRSTMKMSNNDCPDNARAVASSADTVSEKIPIRCPFSGRTFEPTPPDDDDDKSYYDCSDVEEGLDDYHQGEEKKEEEGNRHQKASKCPYHEHTQNPKGEQQQKSFSTKGGRSTNSTGLFKRLSLHKLKLSRLGCLLSQSSKEDELQKESMQDGYKISGQNLKANTLEILEETCSISELKDKELEVEESKPLEQQLGFSAEQTQLIFPYHIVVDSDFRILQVGKALPCLLFETEDSLVGQLIENFLKINKPILASWDWPILHKLADQTFYLVPLNRTAKSTKSSGVRMQDPCDGITFKGNMIDMSYGKAMFVLSPRAKNVNELTDMGLTMSDLPLHSFQRDAIFLGEHIASEVKSAHKLDKLSKKLQNEKNLSNTLLYNMLPRSVADELRTGKTVEPTHYENVTLFFSDIVGFTSLCDAVEPWDVIDMLNKLYSIMDHLSEHFNLYKVETIGDAYMCCSGLPVPDERHAENIANFAICVMECVKHVKSPVDGSPIKLRIGIHTGHCMGGVVGTLTPHYCLFGDMVNTTARHESTGQPGRIQCSSILYGRLKHFSAFDSEQYNFTPRGLVMMKGKGEVYTYWLDSGTDDNTQACSEAVAKLSAESLALIKKKKWKKRRYFRKGSVMNEGSICSGSDAMTMLDSRSERSSSDGGTEFTPSDIDELEKEDDLESSKERDAEDDATGSEPRANSEAGSATSRDLDELDDLINEGSTHRYEDFGDDTEINEVSSDVAISDSLLAVNGSSNNYSTISKETIAIGEKNTLMQDVEELINGVSMHSHNSREAVGLQCNDSAWSEIGWDLDLSREDLVDNIHELMLNLLSRCLIDESVEDLPKNWDDIDNQLHGFIHRISTLYRFQPAFHNWRHACHVVLGASFLVAKAQEDGDEGFGLDPDPWFRFAAAFSALIHDAKHLGVPNKQLEAENNALCELYDGSLQEWQSVNIGISIFTVDFPILSRTILQGCPVFIHLVTSAVLATDIASPDVQQKTKEKFERAIVMSEDNKDERIEAALEQFILLADVGHCSQKYDTFLKWNRSFYIECLTNYSEQRGDDPRNGWYSGQIGFLQHYILPLAQRCEKLMPQKCGLEEGVENILKKWKSNGREWTERMIEELAHLATKSDE